MLADLQIAIVKIQQTRPMTMTMMTCFPKIIAKILSIFLRGARDRMLAKFQIHGH